MKTSAIRLAIGGMGVQVASPHREIVAHLTDRYHKFLSNEAPDFELAIAFAEGVTPAEFLDAPPEMLQEFIRRDATAKVGTWGQPAPHPRTGGERPSTTEDRLESRPQISHLSRKILFQRSDFAGWIDLEAQRGRSVLWKNMEPFAVESFLRICYAFLAVEHGGLLLHSAGVIRDGRGYIFPGISGTGKSTIASLATERECVLSDEMVVVRKVDGRYLVYSTPFYGTNKSAAMNSSAPLKAIFLPVKDNRVCVRETKPPQALTKLLASVLSFGQEPRFNQRLMDIGADIIAQIPCYALHFRRDTSFWERIGELENGGWQP